MAYAVPQPVTKRLKFMEPSGREIREGWDPMDMSYMQLLDTANAAAGPAEEAPAEVRSVARGDLPHVRPSLRSPRHEPVGMLHYSRPRRLLRIQGKSSRCSRTPR